MRSQLPIQSFESSFEKEVIKALSSCRTLILKDNFRYKVMNPRPPTVYELLKLQKKFLHFK